MLKEEKLNVTTEYDFDEWMTLHKTDPAAFEEKREAAIAELIESAPESMRPRLKGLMFQIDAERIKAKTPLQSCINISNLMWKKFHELKVSLNAACNPEKLSADEKNQFFQSKGNENATILEFKKKS